MRKQSNLNTICCPIKQLISACMYSKSKIPPTQQCPRMLFGRVNRYNSVVGAFAKNGNLDYGHTLIKALDQVRRLTGKVVERCYVDHECRGHDTKDTGVVISDSKCDMTTQMNKEMIRQNAIRANHQQQLKPDLKLDRNYLTGMLSD